MLEQVSQSKVFGGWQKQYTHTSSTLNCTMRFAIFLPPGASQQNPVPVLYWLSGLTCTDENFMQKAGAFKKAAECGIAIVAPDTSPRGEQVPDDPQGQYDLGHGAGFYLDAVRLPWDQHYSMYSYVVKELPKLIETHFPVTSVRSISGHSMGGHGALTIGIKHSDDYRSVSAFSPICHPGACPWGQKAFRAYLGENRGLWLDYDAVELFKTRACTVPVLIDQGEADPFLEEQLKPEDLLAVINKQHPNFHYRSHPGYDHSYYFIQSFIGQHLEFHAKYLYPED
ncbi:S-formylglutathione hydrolase [Vibrio quintilis]|uniref:S-formylglutathione hydrolase n=1 Tax=Vibrio quintilis TaxID=1117707 RepID=A0A1M7YQ24_9VIBR|nr:S-formylglutathione hydrolase [Vibrio quintilis]SHO54684.1 S-formylglutathione hydrolase FrmB [Vibrio quintilis]